MLTCKARPHSGCGYAPKCSGVHRTADVVIDGHASSLAVDGVHVRDVAHAVLPSESYLRIACT